MALKNEDIEDDFDQEQENEHPIGESKDGKKPKRERGIAFGNISNVHLVALLGLGYILYHIFSADSAITACYSTQQEVDKATIQIDKINKGIKQDCVIINGLNNNKEFLIKYVREYLYLSQENEDIYILEEE